MKQTNIQKSLRGLAAIVSFILLFTACQKETSVEKGAFNGTAEGELIDSLGFCKNITIAGKYMMDTTLNTSNYVTVNINFTGPGKYKVYSDTVNGMWFLDSGFVVSSGQTAIKLKGKGTPILDKKTDFVVYYGNNICSFSINVTNSTGGTGSGGTNSTEYFPMTVGSQWVYDFIPDIGSGANTVDTFSVIVEPGQVQPTGDPLSYSIFVTPVNGVAYYFAKNSAGDYYAFSTVDFDYIQIFEEIPNSFISYPFLKPNAAKGATWESGEYGKVKVKNGSTIEEGNAKAKFEVYDKGIMHTVHGKTYSDVIVMKRTIVFKPDSGTERNLLVGFSYYAKGYGMIDQVLGAGPDLSTTLWKLPDIK